MPTLTRHEAVFVDSAGRREVVTAWSPPQLFLRLVLRYLAEYPDRLWSATDILDLIDITEGKNHDDSSNTD